MKKQNYILPIFLIFTFVSGQSVRQSNLILSANVSGTHQLSILGTTQDNGVDMGFSGTLEGDFYKVENVSIGIGSEFMLERELEDNLGGIKFTNSFFGTLKILMSSPESSKVYAKARLGYARPKGNKDYEGDGLVTYNGGLSYGLGGEIYFSSKNFIEILYLNYSGDVGLYDIDYGSFDIDVKHSHLNIGFGITL